MPSCAHWCRTASTAAPQPPSILKASTTRVHGCSRPAPSRPDHSRHDHSRHDAIDHAGAVPHAAGARGPSDALVNGIHRRLDQLTRHPYSGMLREDIGPGIRHLLAGRYLVFYRVTPKQVEILRVLHGRRGIVQPFM
ncbi:MAG: hypothetical protein CMO30_15465 [Tistrella sp.]|nr:hypothetical protein [Tistrella sp.]MBA76666.1 hypothetical protein [Tistrella sp.]